MLRLFSAGSGEEVAALDASEFDAMVAERGSTVASLKRHLAETLFEKRYSRFQLRILREGDPTELHDDKEVVLPMDLQLIFMNHLPADRSRDLRFVDSCQHGRVDEVKQSLEALQDPNVSGECGASALVLAAGRGRFDVLQLLLEAGAKRSENTILFWM